MLERSVVGSGAVIGRGATLVDAVVGAEVWIDPGERLGGSAGGATGRRPDGAAPAQPSGGSTDACRVSDSTVGPGPIRRACALVLVVAIVAAISSASGSPALGADSFRFHGSGYGHGIGMSQWGAYGLAQKGWSYARILTHFYADTRVAEAATRHRRRCASGSRAGDPRSTSARRPVRSGCGSTDRGRRSSRRSPAGRRGPCPPPQRCGSTRSAITPARWSAASDGVVPGRPLFVTYEGAGSRVFVPEADEIWHAGYTYAYGFLEFDLFRCADGCVQRLTIELPFERYLRGLGEMPSSWPGAALRAQVVAARTFAIYKIRRYGLRSDCDCHLVDGSGDQVYVGWSKEVGPDGDRWVAAVVDTTGEVVTYGGSVIQAFYAASDGGYSEDVEDVWHGGNAAYAIPYLRGVCDPGEYTSANPWTDWTRSFSAATLSSRLAPYTGWIGTVSGFSDVRRGESGRIVSARAHGSGGIGVGLRNRATVRPRAPGRPGLDQPRPQRRRHVAREVRRADVQPGTARSPVLVLDHGSRQLFERGGLYRNGRVDLTVWLRGGIHREYRAVGDASGRLGLPVSSADRPTRTFAATACSGCRRLVLEGGRIYLKPGLGAHALWGPVLSAYLSRGGAPGSARVPDDEGRARRRRRPRVVRARRDRVRERDLRRAGHLTLSRGGAVLRRVARALVRGDEPVDDRRGVVRGERGAALVRRRARLPAVPRRERERPVGGERRVRREERGPARVRDLRQPVHDGLRDAAVGLREVVHEDRSVLEGMHGARLRRLRVEHLRLDQRRGVVQPGGRRRVGVGVRLARAQVLAGRRAARGLLGLRAARGLRDLPGLLRDVVRAGQALEDEDQGDRAGRDPEHRERAAERRRPPEASAFRLPDPARLLLPVASLEVRAAARRRRRRPAAGDVDDDVAGGRVRGRRFFFLAIRSRLRARGPRRRTRVPRSSGSRTGT